MHPRFEPLWSAATDLGMIALLHVGYNPASADPAWANVDGDMMLLRHLGVSQGYQSMQLILNGMVFGGTFDRHPNLTVLIAECGSGAALLAVAPDPAIVTMTTFLVITLL